ncbi:carboxypeptidase regulatory-like domain-containing protein [Corallococcus llansteffanensis]|uniref:Carboxypeptidase regulatory-like domain-containing protein n=1 Tax=Corallococcus llansteffanensis TaxID=2316731 RepID=A0A3A8PIY3_9BACT|nr:carboxypeptidase regulatory-like domain-containing protein [Corallococcus llansteffanensis]
MYKSQHPPRHQVRTFDATSDETGHFVLKLDKPLTGTLTAEAEGLLPRKLQVQAPASGLRLALDAGATVRGTVTNSDGAPVHDVDVTLVKEAVKVDPETSESGERAAFAGSTEEDGHFTLRGLPPGAYAVWVRATTGGGYEHRMPERVEVRGSETVELSLHLDLDGRIAGVVVDARGEPLAGVDVEANARPDSANDVRTYAPVSVKTGPDGRFVLEHLARDADYELVAQKPGYAMPQPPEEPIPERDGDETDEELHEQMSRWMHDQGDPHVVAHTRSLAVRIVLATQGRITGRLVKGNGAPITRFSVNEEAVRDPRGAFTVFVDKPGLEHLTFQVPGHALTQRDVKVPAGRDVDLGEVRIDTGHTVRGRVVDDATGKPLAGVEVSLQLPRDAVKAEDVAAQEDEDLMGYSGFNSFLDATTGPDGTFTLPAVESRPYVLTARHPGSDYASIERTLGPTEDTLELRLVGETRLEVRVTGPDGQPHGAMVSAREVGAFEAKNFLSEGDGLTVFRDLEPGDYVVGPRARSEEYAAPYKTVRVEAHRVTRTEFQLLPKGATVTVRWGERGAQGQTFLFPGPIPLPKSDEEREQLHWSALRTGSQGNDSWSNVAPGPYTLVVLHHKGGGKWLSYRQDVTVGTDDTQEVVVPTIQW